MDVSLVMFKSDGTRGEFALKRPRTVIGRNSSCDLRIPVGSVSREHCELLFESDQVVVRDLGSSNGTYHNDIRVQEAQLAAGDELMVGPVLFTVVIDGEPASIEPVRTALQRETSHQVNDSRPSAPMASAGPSSDPVAGDDAAGHDDAHRPTEDMEDPISALEALADIDDLTFLSDDDSNSKSS